MLALGLCLLHPSRALADRSVTLAWNPNPESGITNYSVYFGTVSGQYTGKISAGNQTQATIPGLIEGSTYFFVVTAADRTGFESRPSNEISYTVPGTGLTIKPLGANGWIPALMLNSLAPRPAAGWVLEASADLKTWGPITRGTEPIAQIALILSGNDGPYFRFRSLTPATRLTTKAAVKGFPDATLFSMVPSSPAPWQLDVSSDMKAWTTVAAGTNLPLNVTRLPSTNQAMFFRLRSE